MIKRLKIKLCWGAYVCLHAGGGVSPSCCLDLLVWRRFNEPRPVRSARPAADTPRHTPLLLVLMLHTLFSLCALKTQRYTAAITAARGGQNVTKGIESDVTFSGLINHRNFQCLHFLCKVTLCSNRAVWEQFILSCCSSIFQSGTQDDLFLANAHCFQLQHDSRASSSVTLA